MRILLFGWLGFDTDDVSPSDLTELHQYAAEHGTTLQALIEDALRSMAGSGVIFTPPRHTAKNFDLNCSNFPQFAKGRIKH